MVTRVLIVDDEAPIRDMVRFSLELSGYEVLEADDVKTGMALIDDCDVLLLDWMLPNQSGIDMIKRLRAHQKTQDLPIIMLTALAKEDSKVTGLKAGADDYIVKPFSPRELIARIETLLRRIKSKKQGRSADNEDLEVGDIRIDSEGHRVYLKGELVKTGPMEYKLLYFLMGRPGKVFSRQQLLDYVWGNVYINERTIDVHIRRLRKMLAQKDCQDYIRTVRGSGYRFNHPEEG
ncbi:MAG: phosphate regulon transcriptional regulator PhoB [Gammaproteobacteria bacterium]